MTLLVLATKSFSDFFVVFLKGVPKNVPSLVSLTEEGTTFFRTLGTFCTYRNCLHFFVLFSFFVIFW